MASAMERAAEDLGGRGSCSIREDGDDDELLVARRAVEVRFLSGFSVERVVWGSIILLMFGWCYINVVG